MRFQIFLVVFLILGLYTVTATNATLVWVNVTPINFIGLNNVFSFDTNISYSGSANVSLNIQSVSGLNFNLTTNSISASEFNTTYNATTNTTYRVTTVFTQQNLTNISFFVNTVFRLFNSVELYEQNLQNAIMSLAGSEDTKSFQANLSINKNSSVDFVAFNISASPYENKTTFDDNAFDGWKCFDYNDVPNPNSATQNCSVNSGQVTLFASGGISISGARINKTYNMTNLRYISFDYNATQMDKGFFFGVGGNPVDTSSSNVAVKVTSTGSGTVNYFLGNLSGLQTITLGVWDDGVNPGTTVLVDNIRLYSYPKDVIVDIGNYSGGNELNIPGYLIGQNANLQYFNNSQSPFNITFLVASNLSQGLLLPFGANVTLATINISGFNDNAFFASNSNLNTTYNFTASGISGFVFSNSSTPSANGQADVKLDQVVGGSNFCKIINVQALGITSVGTSQNYNCATLNDTQIMQPNLAVNSSNNVFCLRLKGTTGVNNNSRVRWYFSGTNYLDCADNTTFLLYNNTGFEYPINLSLDVGADGVKEISTSNNFSSVNNKYNLSSAISSYLATCTYDSNNICTIPFVFASDGRGVLEVNELYINYTNVTYVSNFNNISNDYIHDQCVSDGYNCTLPIRVTYNVPGNITFLNLDNFYTVPQPTITVDNPSQGEQYVEAKVQMDFTISNYTNSSCKYSLQYPSLLYEVNNLSMSCANHSIQPQITSNYTLWLYSTDSFGRDALQKINISIVALGGSALGGEGSGIAPSSNPAVCGDSKCEIFKGETYFNCAIDCGTLQNISIEGLSGNIPFVEFVLIAIALSLLILFFVQDKVKKRRKEEGMST